MLNRLEFMKKIKTKLKKTYKSNKEGTIAIIAAIFVLFSAMINPIFSVGISFAALVGYSIYFFSKK